MGEVAKKEGIIKRSVNYGKAVRSEMKKVVWPTRKQLINNSLIVIAAIIIIGLIIFGLDLGFTALARLVLGR